ncbi:TetR/AcrR family transcriptional regulator [Actinokineospora sp. UTMC 2448]|uniref:TetR/AcrR family transcriptional regulator n=1 Tax=Actinokineospora sp. UTMC 2448 TaxID=2268449 RepID=UPI0021642227|nr:TetR/AcrR family transcriptional regulator [Actinokineospora sp. UTMC 2448]UVS79143.1 putative transcriptional regulator [Actinokineospora sp. UTMC 2448]
MDHDEAALRVLDAADALFYERGVQAVGMDAIRAASGVPFKRLYRCYPSKERLVAEYLRRRDQRWRRRMADFVDERTDPAERVLAVFDWLGRWFAEPGFRGCAFVNSFGEFGAPSVVADIAREHKDALRHYLDGLVACLPVDARLAEELLLLIDGAIVSASIMRNPNAADSARAAASALLVARMAQSTAP